MLFRENALDQSSIRQDISVQVVIDVVLELGQIAKEIGHLEFDRSAFDGIGRKQIGAVVDQVQPVGVGVIERSRGAGIVVVNQQNFSTKTDGVSAFVPDQVLFEVVHRNDLDQRRGRVLNRVERIDGVEIGNR